MDREQFDILARLVGAKHSRRSAVGALLGAALLGHGPAAALAKGRGRDKAKGKVQTTAKRCYPGTRCTPGRGTNTSGCDFTDSQVLFEGDFRGANLSNSNFTGAVLAKGDFRGANLSGACLVRANLLEAKLGSSVNLDNAIYCHTLMPDGSLNNRDCGKGTACCPAPSACTSGECEAGTCTPHHTWCSVFGNPCCADAVCTPILQSPFLTTCQTPCTVDSDCKNDPGTKCGGALDAEFCPYILLTGHLCCE
jgi:hypothetical protein